VTETLFLGPLLGAELRLLRADKAKDKRGKQRGSSTRVSRGATGSAGAAGRRRAGRRPLVKFLVLFVSFWLAFFFLAWVFTDRLMVLCPWTAGQVSFVLRLLGIESSVSGCVLTFGSKAVTIVMECTALQVAMIYAALVLSYPSSMRAKLVGLGLGLPLILAVNIVRLLVICFVLAWKPKYFEMMHIYVWQVVFIVIVIAMAAVWIEKVVHRERRPSVSG